MCFVFLLANYTIFYLSIHTSSKLPLCFQPLSSLSQLLLSRLCPRATEAALRSALCRMTSLFLSPVTFSAQTAPSPFLASLPLSLFYLVSFFSLDFDFSVSFFWQGSWFTLVKLYLF